MPVPLLLKDVEDSWRVTFRAVREGFPGQDKMAAFLRHYWIAERKFVRMQVLYREISAWLKGPDTDPANPKNLVLVPTAEQRKRLSDVARSLRGSAGRYVWLAGGEEGDNFDASQYRDSEQYLAAIPAFGGTQVLPLLLAILNRSPDPNEFARLSRSIEGMIVRRSLAGAPPNDVEQAVEPMCRKYVTGAATIGDVRTEVNQLAAAAKGDDVFRLAHVSSADARYILLALENHARAKTKPPRMPMPYDIKKIDVEHILPETTKGSGWDEGAWPRIDDAKTRLGNFALLDRSANRAAKNAVFFCKAAKATIVKRVVCCKRHAYELNKDIELTTRLAQDFRSWTPATLEKRSAQLAALAEERWPLV